MQSPRRVVITGLGLISPLGNDPQALWDALENQRSGIDYLQAIPHDHLPSKIGGESRDFHGEIEDFGTLEKDSMRAIKKGLRLMCREIEMGVAAAQLAIQHSQYQGTLHPDRVGTIYGCDYILTGPEEFTNGVRKCRNGSGEFDFSQWAEQGIGEVTPLWLLKYLPNMPASHIAIYNDFRGPNNSITLREASANLAIGEAFCTIQRGNADMIIAGSTGTRVHAVRSLHVSLQEQLASNNGDPKAACRPFDRERTGMVMGEGAGALVLEELSSALARNARIYGEVIGYGSSTVNQNGIAKYGTALKNSIASCLRTGKVTADEIGHINAHGLSTIKCDHEEGVTINSIFGNQKPVVAMKSYMGNLGAGSGTVELIGSLLALEHDQLFPVLNFQQADPGIDINIVTTNDVSAGASVLKTNVTLQGQASAILIRKFVD
jgi:3-oxoacyl-[acyl-carrier-protein] synthase II